MENILKIAILCITFGSYLKVSMCTSYEASMDCIQESLAHGSNWACGFCLDVCLVGSGNKRTVAALKMENRSECEKQEEKGECISSLPM